MSLRLRAQPELHPFMLHFVVFSTLWTSATPEKELDTWVRTIAELFVKNLLCQPVPLIWQLHTALQGGPS